MNGFLNTLPWRLASLAALVVGIVSLATGAADAWSGLERVAIAFVAFYLIGSVAKTLLVVGERSPERHQTKPGAVPREGSVGARRQTAAVSPEPDRFGVGSERGAGGPDGSTNL